jgi:hypothetical protein
VINQRRIAEIVEGNDLADDDVVITAIYLTEQLALESRGASD